MTAPTITTRLRSSVVWQTLVICFIATHVPLIAIIAYIAYGDWTSIPPLTLIVVTVLATVIGTGLSLGVIYQLISPIEGVLRGIDAYRRSGIVPTISLDRTDEVGRLASGVGTLIRDLSSSLESLRRQAHSDPLTGLSNRRSLLESGISEIERARRHGHELALVVIDVDRFKMINDTHGHNVGDDVLCALSEILRSGLRPYDVVARLGGEEFCALLPDTDAQTAARVAERLRVTLQRTRIGNLPAGAVTASFGIALLRDRENIRELINRADRHLYEAKSGGRNRVVIERGTDLDEETYA